MTRGRRSRRADGNRHGRRLDAGQGHGTQASPATRVPAFRSLKAFDEKGWLPAARDSRAGCFEPNVNDPTTQSRWAIETVLLHEAVPRHHLQTSRALELTGLPRLRRFTGFVANGAGRALYAESPGDEMGSCKDPCQKFGNLSVEMLRACRLVVDAGIHAYGWIGIAHRGPRTTNSHRTWMH